MEYTLVENKLTKDIEDDYSARTVNSIKRNREHLVSEITRHGSILKPTETKAVIEAYWNQIIDYIREGEEYRDEHIAVNLSITGSFIGEEERFNHDVHEVNVSLSASNLIKIATRDIRPRYIDPNYDRPVVTNVYDWDSETEDDIISPKGVVEIKGLNLKIYEQGIGAGVFFINKANADEVKVEKLRTNEPRTLVFKAPMLPAGKYKLEIRNSTRNSMNTRVGTSTVEYTVE